jgi:transcriptional regulator with PAS, ATPase and Fis domain
MTQEISRIKRKDKGVTKFSDIIGYNTGLRETVSVAAKSASSNIPVLISGETGVGKEVFSRSIHGEGNRVLSHFIAVNCGAIPQNLAESTLFGHEKGAFTGADRKYLGKFREAEGGTIFLDEIGELPLGMQVKLLRVLQQKEIEPVGCGKPIAIDVRIISATNKNLLDEVKAGNFREDLYFRLNVMNIIIPPLRERKQDILLLASHFIKHFAVLENLSIKNISSAAESLLLNYNWSGNVRELENIIHRAMVLYDGNILGEEEFNYLLENESYEMELNQIEPEYSPYTINMCNNNQIKTMEEIEKEVISLAIKLFDHNVTLAAKSLAIAKSTFYRKMKQYNLS